MVAGTRKPTATKAKTAEVEKLAAFLKARAPAEDIADYDLASSNMRPGSPTRH
jgi:hypothetical protein